MKQLKIHNSLSKEKEIFYPLQVARVSFYVCGPTVYEDPHLGNILSVVFYDLVFRVLRHIYGNDNVTYVRNITDVDDKIINSAKEKGISVYKLTEETIERFHQDVDRIFCLRPNFEPRVTENIEQIISLIKILLDRDNAYIADDGIYFRVNSFVDYYKLSGRRKEELESGHRVQSNTRKDEEADFVLWKFTENETDKTESIFESPWGKGRPGWHIECSAMSHRYLSADFDIHGGGIDLIFPHHTNEIAQSRCAFPASNYAKYWLHNGFLTVEGEKMSKSLGNFITLRNLLEQQIDPEIIRFVLLSSHYRKPSDWTKELLNNSKKALDSFYRVLEDSKTENEIIDEDFIDALCDDFNTPEAIARMHFLASEYNKSRDIIFAERLNYCGKFLGLFNKNADDWFRAGKTLDEAEILSLIAERNEAKKQKNWVRADEIRSYLKDNNIILEDKPDGSSIWRTN